MPDNTRKQRVIVHVDMDAFFASVEQLLHPEYKGKPVIVGADPQKRGVVSAASYEARRFGIKSAMPISTAYRLCPHGVFLPVNGKCYSLYSKKLYDVLYQLTPLVEMASVDEAFLDVTGCLTLPDDPFKLGHFIKKTIKDTIGLMASVGIAPNKFLAKIASDLKKPDGLVVVGPGKQLEFLAPLPVERMWGVGRKTAILVHRYHIRTIGDIHRFTIKQLERMFGNNLGKSLYYLSRGIDDREVIAEPSGPKSIGHETTFNEDISDMRIIKAAIGKLSQDVGSRLRKKGLCARCVTLKIRFDDFTTITRAKSITDQIDQDHKIYDQAVALLNKIVLRQKVRLIGVTVSKLDSPDRQITLFASDDEHDRKLYQSIDKIRSKFGKESVFMGSSMLNKARP